MFLRIARSGFQNLRHAGLALCGILATLYCNVETAVAQPVDARTILQGLQHSRDTVHTGQMKIHVTVNRQEPMPHFESADLSVVFSGVHRTVTENRRVLVVNTEAGGSHEKLIAMNYDREAFVRAGLARWKDERVCSTWDGSEYFQYGELHGAKFRAHQHGTSAFAMDPRLLGLRIGNTVTATLSTTIFPADGGRHEHLGMRVYRQMKIHHIRSTWPGVAQIEYFIEDGPAFRLHWCEMSTQVGKETFESEYANDTDVLPIQVTEDRITNGKLQTRVVFSVIETEFGLEVDSRVGTFRSVEMPVGAEIFDDRTRLRVGYWDGEEVVESRDRALARSQLRESEATSKRWLFRGVLGAACAATCILFYIGIRRSFSRGRPSR